MFNRMLYWFVTLPRLVKGGCLSLVGVFFACSCLVGASIPGARARQQEYATATGVAIAQAATDVSVQATATSVGYATATVQAQYDATATSSAIAEQATATAIAIPTATAQAELDATATADAQATATMQAQLDATAAANTQATAQAAQTAQAQVAAERATATAEARIQATATIANYVNEMPKGWWGSEAGGIEVWAGNFTYTNKAGYSDAGRGSKFVAFSVSIFNNGLGDLHVNPNFVTLIDANGRTYAHASETYSYWKEPMQAVDVGEGNRADGGIVFLIDSDTAPAQIVYDTNKILVGKIKIDLRRAPDQQQ